MLWGNKVEDDHVVDDSTGECVRVLGTDMYYYGDIDDDNILEFITKFKKISCNLLNKEKIY